MGYLFSVIRVKYLTRTLQMLDESSKASLIADLYMLEESIKSSLVTYSLEKSFYLVDLPYGDGDEVLAHLPILEWHMTSKESIKSIDYCNQWIDY